MRECVLSHFTLRRGNFHVNQQKAIYPFFASRRQRRGKAEGGNEFSITTYKRTGNSQSKMSLRRVHIASGIVSGPEKISKLNFGISIQV